MALSTSLSLLIKKIEILEDKRDNGTITMDEETQLVKLIDRCEELLYK